MELRRSKACAGGADTARASLLTSGGFLQAPSADGCQLQLAPSDSAHVIVGESLKSGCLQRLCWQYVSPSHPTADHAPEGLQAA